jgi:hypothetical protein
MCYSSCFSTQNMGRRLGPKPGRPGPQLRHCPQLLPTPTSCTLFAQFCAFPSAPGALALHRMHSSSPARPPASANPPQSARGPTDTPASPARPMMRGAPTLGSRGVRLPIGVLDRQPTKRGTRGRWLWLRRDREPEGETRGTKFRHARPAICVIPYILYVV